MKVDYDKDQLAYALANALKERDEAREKAERHRLEANAMMLQRDEARERIERQKLEINRLNGATNHAGGTPLKIALRERDEWAAMCGRYKQERDIAEQDATNYHARIIELIAERYKTKQERHEAITRRMETIMQCQLYEQERDEAREENAKLRDIAERAINYLDQSYRYGFADESSELRYELAQLKEGAK